MSNITGRYFVNLILMFTYSMWACIKVLDNNYAIATFLGLVCISTCICNIGYDICRTIEEKK